MCKTARVCALVCLGAEIHGLSQTLTEPGTETSLSRACGDCRVHGEDSSLLQAHRRTSAQSGVLCYSRKSSLQRSNWLAGCALGIEVKTWFSSVCYAGLPRDSAVQMTRAQPWVRWTVEKEMAARCWILAWRTPWTEELLTRLTKGKPDPG